MAHATPSDPILSALGRAALFADLDAERIAAIAGIAERVVFKPGDVIVAGNTPADHAVVIAWGACTRADAVDAHDALAAEVMTQAASQTDGHAGAGSVLSEMAMFVDTEHAETLIATTAVRALRLHREDMLGLLAADPDMADHLVQQVASRLHGVFDALAECEADLGNALNLSEMRMAMSGRPSLPLSPAELH